MNYKEGMLREDALVGKVIVITGGGSGLGKAMTKYFLELGAKVAITSRNLEKLKGTAEELEKETGGKVLPVQCDVRHYDQVEAMLKACLDEYGQVDGLLNNAAGNFISPTERLSANAFDTIIPGLPFYPFVIIVILTQIFASQTDLQRRLLQAREQSSYTAKLNIIFAITGVGLALLFVV